MSACRRSLAVRVLCLLVPLVVFGSACRKPDDRPKLAVVQELAADLGVAKRVKQRRGCQVLVAAQRDVLLCDGMLQTLLHYAPGFAGSQVAARGRSSGGDGSPGRPVTLPVRYKGALGEGALDVQLQLEEGRWRIAGLLPR
jgi:hypothetical protein